MTLRAGLAERGAGPAVEGEFELTVAGRPWGDAALRGRSALCLRDGLAGLDVFEVEWSAGDDEVFPRDTWVGAPVELALGRRGACATALVGELSALESETGNGGRVMRLRGRDRLAALCGAPRSARHAMRTLGDLARALARAAGVALAAGDGPDLPAGSALLEQRMEPDVAYLRRVARALGHDLSVDGAALALAPIPQPATERVVLAPPGDGATLRWSVRAGGPEELSGTAAGDPRLRAGRLLVVRTGGPEEGLYRLQGTLHRVDAVGYRTRFSAVRCAG
ncbi:MAG: hypothetical protein HZA54_03450 [Planctomycetes bacterium]|nr:hypothetical protein [Planctomycetota bacterium]